MDTLEHATLQVNGIKMHYVTMGQGKPVVLLHGFPQSWYIWRHIIPTLATKFKVIAPDLRGFGDTEKPPAVQDYYPGTIAQDIIELIKALGYEKASLVGHDFGGAAAWQVSIEHPEVVDHLVIINCPHPKLMVQALQKNPRQMLRSWYMFVFQIPKFPEWLFKKYPRKIIGTMLEKGAVKKTFSEEDIDYYVKAMERPGAFTAGINYYRGAFRALADRDVKKEFHKITVPTLLIWGEDDPALGIELTKGMEPLFSAPFKTQYVKNCGHFVAEEEPELVSQLLLQFLG